MKIIVGIVSALVIAIAGACVMGEPRGGTRILHSPKPPKPR